MLSRLLVASLLMTPGFARANDTMAELETGGLVYVQSEEISMEEEDLFISRDEIRVRYVFSNSSDHDVSSIVAFPMPDIPGQPDGMLAIHDMEADNFLDFSVSQDGKPIAPMLQQRIVATGIDMTDELVARGIPLLPYSAATSQALEELPETVKADWIGKGLIFADRYDEGEGMIDHLIPLWTLKSVYWWKTTFPAGKQVTVEHRYRPSVGGTVDVTYLEDGEPTGERYRDYLERYCIDDTMVKIARKSDAAMRAGKPHYVENWISYVLTTGANWQGPIRRFKLTIDKGRTQDYVSFCGEGVRKTGPTTFEMTAEDFFPQKDLHVLFLMATD